MTPFGVFGVNWCIPLIQEFGSTETVEMGQDLIYLAREKKNEV
jgi:hypothetical protein